MNNSMASYAWRGFVQCPDCKGWYDPIETPGCVIRDRLDDRTVCLNCAHLMDWQGCYNCGAVDGAHDCVDRWLCYDCAKDEGWTFCDHCEKGFGDDELVDCGGNMLCEECRDSLGWSICDGCREWHHSNDLMPGSSYDNYCRSCWNELYTTCASCGGVISNDDCRWYRDEPYCDGCVPTSEFEPNGGYEGSRTYAELTSRRRFGVELETNSCDDYQDLDGNADWGAKPDPSVCGQEFYSRILAGDDGLDAIRRLCRFADRHGWDVDRRCGYHAHFDMTNESDDSLKGIACAYLLTYNVWNKFVDPNRVGGRYCHGSHASISEIYNISNFTNFAWNQTRYEWVNFVAYSVHSTFEVRLHQGTLDANEVCNWVKAHATFMDWASNAGWAKVRNTLLCMNDAERFDFIAQVWRDAGCGDLEDYYGNKARANCAGWLETAVCA